MGQVDTDQAGMAPDELTATAPGRAPLQSEAAAPGLDPSTAPLASADETITVLPRLGPLLVFSPGSRQKLLPKSVGMATPSL